MYFNSAKLTNCNFATFQYFSQIIILHAILYAFLWGFFNVTSRFSFRDDNDIFIEWKESVHFRCKLIVWTHILNLEKVYIRVCTCASCSWIRNNWLKLSQVLYVSVGISVLNDSSISYNLYFYISAPLLQNMNQMFVYNGLFWSCIKIFYKIWEASTTDLPLCTCREASFQLTFNWLTA